MIAVLQECKLLGRPNSTNRTNVKCLIKIRRTFYNQALFDYVTEAEVAGSKVKTTWWDFVLNFLMTVSILVTLVYYVPGVMGRWWPTNAHLGTTTDNVSAMADNAYLSAGLVSIPQSSTEAVLAHKVQPAYDLEIDDGRWIVSDSAGIKAPIYTNDDVADDREVNKILDQGIYMYPEYNNIGWQGKRLVLAGHHYNMAIGEQKAQQSFQNLNKLQVGDTVQVVDDYKIWTYEIYKIEEATAVSEENADLTMYTCIFWWDSKLRLFVYGRIVESQPLAMKL